VERCSTQLEPGKLIFRFRAFSQSFFVVAPVVIAIFAAAFLSDKHNGFGRLFDVWYAVIVVLFIYAWLWNVAGVERLEFTLSELIQRRVLFGIVRTKTYSATQVGAPYFDVRPGRKGRVRTSIAFSYSEREIHICESIKASEVNELVTAVLRQLPELTWPWGRYVEATFSRKKGYTFLDLK
jgi:hypothetical protein